MYNLSSLPCNNDNSLTTSGWHKKVLCYDRINLVSYHKGFFISWNFLARILSSGMEMDSCKFRLVSRKLIPLERILSYLSPMAAANQPTNALFVS